MTQSVWFVTGKNHFKLYINPRSHRFNENESIKNLGCSSGFGQEIATIALERGDKVIATARNLSSIETISWPRSNQHADSSDDSGNLRLMQLDVEWDEDKIKAVIDEAVAVWGRIDVLVNNAGYSVSGIAEEIG
jgi:NADP-dependent 3-hydroxy acid dehydrogenase YdfG